MTNFLIILFTIAVVGVLVIAAASVWQLVHSLRGKRPQEITVFSGKDALTFSVLSIFFMHIAALASGDFFTIDFSTYVVISGSFGLSTAGVVAACRRQGWTVTHYAAAISVALGIIAGVWGGSLPV